LIRILEGFYQDMSSDSRVAKIFEDLDMDEHIETISKFWAGLLLGESDYRGNPFVKHLFLGLEASHFEVWLEYFRKNIDRRFSGKVCKMAIDRAEGVAINFQRRLALNSF
jgi:hemoglobin